jgi:hypothetical protein
MTIEPKSSATKMLTIKRPMFGKGLEFRHVSEFTLQIIPVFRIRIRIGSVLNWVSGSGSGFPIRIRQAKIVPQKRKIE